MLCSCISSSNTIRFLLVLEIGTSKLNSCERVALVSCVNACRTVSIATLEVLNGDLPWRLEAVRRDCKFRLKRDLPISYPGLIEPDETLERGKILKVLKNRLWER